jgi:hypothetical protein
MLQGYQLSYFGQVMLFVSFCSNYWIEKDILY